jgi:hypothetical protein
MLLMMIKCVVLSPKVTGIYFTAMDFLLLLVAGLGKSGLTFAGCSTFQIETPVQSVSFFHFPQTLRVHKAITTEHILANS